MSMGDTAAQGVVGVFGRRVRRAREALGWSMHTLTAKAGLGSAATVWGTEHGTRRQLTLGQRSPARRSAWAVPGRAGGAAGVPGV